MSGDDDDHAQGVVVGLVVVVVSRRTFEMFSDYCNKFSGLVPVGFVLGFFVTMVVGRWWDQFNTIPWPANVALLVSANIQVTCRLTELWSYVRLYT